MYPKITLKADFASGQGEIGNIDKWRNHHALLRADILQDWIALLTQEYDIALNEMNRVYESH
jgi:hypothetical protein